jgi:hypothetical protein
MIAWSRFDTFVVLAIVALGIPAIAVTIRTAPGRPAPKPSTPGRYRTKRDDGTATRCRSRQSR